VALGRAYIEIHADTKPFRRDLDDTVKNTLRNSTQGIGKAATQGISQGLKTFRFIPGTFQGILITGLAGVIIGAAPAIASALSAMFTTALGLAGIGAGVALAITQSPELQSAGQRLGEVLFNGLTSAVGSFHTPILQSIAIIERRFEHLQPVIEQAFASLAPHITTLTQGFVDFISNLMPGVVAAFENAGPAIDEFASQFAHTGEVLSEAFKMLSDDSETLVEGIRLVFFILNTTISGTIGLINLLSEAWQFWVNSMDEASKKASFFSPLAQGMHALLRNLQEDTTTLTPTTDAYGDALVKQGEGANYAAVQGNALVETLREVWNVQLAVSNSAIAFEEAIDGVTESFKENGRTLDINTEKGRENVRQVNQGIEAAIREHDAQIAAGAGVEAANKAYTNRIERLRATLRQAGLTEKQIDSLIGAYSEVPPALTTNVTAPGLPGVLTQMQALARARREAARDVLINVRASGSGAIGGRAEGGVITKPEISWIGEAGPEAVIPLTDPARAQQVMAEAGLVQPMTINIIVDGQVVERRVVRANENQARQITSNPRSI
jgi:hypothetical protein